MYRLTALLTTYTATSPAQPIPVQPDPPQPVYPSSDPNLPLLLDNTAA
jgi:hypothetical protein